MLLVCPVSFLVRYSRHVVSCTFVAFEQRWGRGRGQPKLGYPTAAGLVGEYRWCSCKYFVSVSTVCAVAMLIVPWSRSDAWLWLPLVLTVRQLHLPRRVLVVDAGH